MKVLVIGSCKDQDSPERNAYVKACQEMGAELARRNHTLIVGSKNPKTADAHFLSGANEVTGAHRVIVVRGDDDREVPRHEEFKNLRFLYRRRGDNWSVASLRTRAIAFIASTLLERAGKSGLDCLEIQHSGRLL